jgi:hypothetical protein
MAVDLLVEHCSGANLLQDVAVIGKWVYVDENLILVDKAGEVLAVEPIRNIKKITFSSDEDMAVDNVSSETIVVYPNPTQDILMIKGVDYQTLRVYDMQGRLLKVESGSQINVSSLAEGTYLLQIGTQVVRFIKK